MAYRDYMPADEQDFLAWALNYSGKITLTPTAFGTTAAEATALAALVADYQARLAAATDPGTRTKVTIQQKLASKQALKAKVRQIARVINAYPAITNAQRADLGLNVRNPEPTPFPPPATHPQVAIVTLGGRQAGVNVRDELTPDTRAKPDGVSGAYLWAKIGDAAPTDTSQCQFLGTATRSRHVVTFDAADVNKTVWILAQWVNKKGQAGPLSTPATASIAA